MRIDALSFVSAAAFRDRAHFPEEPCRPPWPVSVTDVGRDDREIFLLSEGRMEIGDGAAGASHSETSNHNACLLLLLELSASAPHAHQLHSAPPVFVKACRHE